MSIANELTKLDAVRDALVESVNSKGGDLAQDSTLWQVKSAIDALETGGGGGGTFDLVAVTSYTPAYANIINLQLSGMGMDEMSGSDFSAANGVYTVTDDTASLPADKKVFKHSSAEYYITYLPESADGMYYSYGWCLANKTIVTDPWGAYMIGPKELVAGTSYWQDEMGMTYQSVTISNIQSTEMPPDVKIRRVTGYSPSTLQYTFAGEEESCSAVDSSTLREHQIYSFDGTSIIGKPIDCEAGSHLRTYIPGRTDPVVRVNRSERNSTSTDGYYLTAWQYPSFYTNEPSRFSLATIDGKSCTFNQYDAERLILWDRDMYANGVFGLYPSDSNRYWSFGALFHSGNQKNKKQMLMVDLFNVAKVYIDIEWNASTPRAVLYAGEGNVVATYSSSSLASSWHHFMMTYDFDTKTLTMYVDGVSRGTYTMSLERTGYFDTFLPYIGRDSGEWYIGHVCEIKFWDVALTAEQVEAEYSRAINS